MKKLFFALFIFGAVSSNAQIMKIQLKDGNIIPVPIKDIASITYDMESVLEGKKAELISDASLGDLMQLASLAQQYYKKPTTLGGGGNRFNGWVIPDALKESSNGNYTAKVETDQVTLVGISKTTKKEGKPLTITIVVTRDRIKETMVE